MANEVTDQKPEVASSSLFSSFMSFVLPTAHAEADDGDKDGKDDEPEDIAPAIREGCEANECAKYAHHFQACQEKVEAGKGWQGEDCVDEMFHMMHCVDACAAPKLFKKLA
ncbi:ubiquinol-cytochrome C reductase hinge domain-containing protein [Kockovaella imperatae]|uniref:Ubiquinol-cytochrome C reductase hinge domain-containing protein n=1 Tax=Kockovaella imperatae TaxID=4999 RepID=A0A1Y1ULW6_9TREE|nr:ubiquinol-cytochrome C reductase hinge domain-containing protein [Kockovaella imperatae]ORX39041.1 ubiquinol-cytochrome C reductase hinge domain-containing protein [Kockovaella imperatae]